MITASHGTTKKPITAQVSAVSHQKIARCTHRPTLTYTADLCPSAEIEFLRKLRQTAQAEAEASGTGRRARAPSRRAVEAAEMDGIEDEQSITNERKEKEAGKRAKAKKERKVVRMSAAVSKPSVSFEGCVLNRDASGGGSDCSSGASSAAGDIDYCSGVVWPTRVLDNRRTITPAELNASIDQYHQHAATFSRASCRLQSVNGARVAALEEQAKFCSDGPAWGINEQRATGEARASAARRFAKKLKRGHLGGSNRKKGSKEGSTGARNDEGCDGSTTRSGGGTVPQTCFFEGCMRVATHGVNDVARFW